MARPAFQPTEDQRLLVKRLVGRRVAQDKIARQLGIAATTLRQYFRAELDYLGGVACRPAHEPTEDTRAAVEILAAARVNQVQIAEYLGLSVPTLERCYRDELDNGYARRNGSVTIALYEKAAEGNVAAIGKWNQLVGLRPPPAPPRPREAPEPELGKKEAALRAAQAPPATAGWASVLKH